MTSQLTVLEAEREPVLLFGYNTGRGFAGHEDFSIKGQVAYALPGRYDDAESFRFAPYATDYFGLFVKAAADAAWEGSYAYRLEYEDVFLCDLARAEMMVRTLKRLQRQMDRFCRVEGSATTFGQYVNRVARALRCKRVCILQDGRGRVCFHTSPGDSVGAIDSIVKHWHEARRAGANA
ncbi:MAG: hypothetical protein IT175_04930 [Acidobacteria bacterium]|nr:hypothetical protein [Acidobacteriota bacterium]